MMRRLILIAVLALAVAGCDDVARESSPVELVATPENVIQRADLAAGCPLDGSVQVRSIVKNPASETTFLDVRLTRARISYRRTDGGTLTPATFVRTISAIVPSGGTTTLPISLFQLDATNGAPFAALMPANGGIDPETGRSVVEMDVILEIFGQTISGENVATSVRLPVDFCYNCGGCTGVE